jgi:hypothetical protein
MSVAELKERIAELPAKERIQIAAFISDLEEQEDSRFRQNIEQRMANMDAGKTVSMEEFERLHERLKQEGR